MYIVDENDGPVQPVLVLSKPSPTDIIIRITTERGTAAGKALLISICMLTQ